MIGTIHKGKESYSAFEWESFTFYTADQIVYTCVVKKSASLLNTSIGIARSSFSYLE